MEKPQNFILTIKYKTREPYQTKHSEVKVDTTTISSGTSLYKLMQLREHIEKEYSVTVISMKATPNKRHDKLLSEKKHACS